MIALHDKSGNLIFFKKEDLFREMAEQDLTIFGLSLTCISELRHLYVLAGGTFPVTRDEIIKIFKEKTVHG
jgi:hypothetical protein